MYHYKHTVCMTGILCIRKLFFEFYGGLFLLSLKTEITRNNALFSPPTFRHGMIFCNRCVGDRVCWSREIVTLLVMKCRLLRNYCCRILVLL